MPTQYFIDENIDPNQVISYLFTSRKKVYLVSNYYSLFYFYFINTTVVFYPNQIQYLNCINISLATKSRRILSLTYGTKYDMT